MLWASLPMKTSTQINPVGTSAAETFSFLLCLVPDADDTVEQLAQGFCLQGILHWGSSPHLVWLHYPSPGFGGCVTCPCKNSFQNATRNCSFKFFSYSESPLIVHCFSVTIIFSCCFHVCGTCFCSLKFRWITITKGHTWMLKVWISVGVCTYLKGHLWFDPGATGNKRKANEGISYSVFKVSSLYILSMQFC